MDGTQYICNLKKKNIMRILDYDCLKLLLTCKCRRTSVRYCVAVFLVGAVPVPAGGREVMKANLLTGWKEWIPVEWNVVDIHILYWCLHNDVHLEKLYSAI